MQRVLLQDSQALDISFVVVLVVVKAVTSTYLFKVIKDQLRKIRQKQF